MTEPMVKKVRIGNSDIRWLDGYGEPFATEGLAVASNQRKIDAIRKADRKTADAIDAQRDKALNAEIQAAHRASAAHEIHNAEIVAAGLDKPGDWAGHPTLPMLEDATPEDVTEDAQKHKVISVLKHALYSVQDAISLANPYASKDTPRDLWRSGTIQEIEADLRDVIDELDK